MGVDAALSYKSLIRPCRRVQVQQKNRDTRCHDDPWPEHRQLMLRPWADTRDNRGCCLASPEPRAADADAGMPYRSIRASVNRVVFYYHMHKSLKYLNLFFSLQIGHS